MWLFWILAGGLAAAAAAVVLGRAATIARSASQTREDPTLSLYRRQLAALDDLAERNLIEPADLQPARTEAARRLLSAAEERRKREGGDQRGAHRLVALSVGGAGVSTLCLYLLLGSPGLPDQPYRARVQAWRHADPATLDPERLAAVLREISRSRPGDAQAFDFLGRAEMAAGDDFAAARALQRAATLAPRRVDVASALGEALVADADGEVTASARAAFNHTLALDPRNAPARYFLARAAISDGRVQAGLAQWRALADDLDVADPKRLALLQEIEQVATTGALKAPSVAQAPDPSGALSAPAGQMAFIRAMVAKQAADLAVRPDDADGWARLVRAYGVLGDRAAQQQALAQARRVFSTRPGVLARVEAQAASGAGPAPAPPG